jgi:hypothetical protein
VASSSYGQGLLRRFLNEIVDGIIVENTRPLWLRGLELDFYLESSSLAFEFQGDQHHVPVFGASALEVQKRNDILKRQLCELHSIALVRVDASDLVASRLVGKIRHALRPRGRHRTRDVFKRAINHAACGALNAEGKAYRVALSRHFGSPTAHRKYSAIRQRASKTITAAH